MGVLCIVILNSVGDIPKGTTVRLGRFRNRRVDGN